MLYYLILASTFISVFLHFKNEELKQEVLKLQGASETTDLEAEMLGISKKRSAIERHKEQLKKLEKDKKEAQGVSVVLFLFTV